MLEELRTLRFIEERSNVLFLGPPGVGKTHLAVALGVEAIKKDYMTYFITVDEIARRLRSNSARIAGQTASTAAHLSHWFPSLMILPW